MNNLIEFGRVFLSYGLLLLIIVALSAAAVALGIFLAKRKNEKKAAEAALQETADETSADTV